MDRFNHGSELVTAMRRTKVRRNSGFTVAELLIVLFLIVGVYFGIIVTALAYWTQRNMDFWGTHFAHHVVHVPFWLDYLLSIVSPLLLLANIIAEIARHF